MSFPEPDPQTPAAADADKTGPAPRALIEVQGLSVALSDSERRFRLLVDHLTLEAGQTISVTGDSGTGKTLLLELLGVLRAPAPGGRYLLADPDLAGGDAVSGVTDLARLWKGARAPARLAALRGRAFGFVPQAGGLMPFLSVRENVALSQRITGREDPSRVEALIAALGLERVAGARPAILSIGQRQRVAIARALAHRPRVLIADEPTAALDPVTAADAMALLIDTTRQDGAALIVSSHDHALLDRFGLDRYALAIAQEGEASYVSQLHRQDPVPCA